MKPSTAEKNVSASAARSSAAHHAATSLALTWPACLARSIGPRLSRWYAANPAAPPWGHPIVHAVCACCYR